MTKAEFFKDILNRTLFLLSVPKCIKCDEALDYGEEALCPDCMAEYKLQKLRNCSRCSKTLDLCMCSNPYLEAHYIKKLVKIYRYNSKNQELPGNLLVYSLKHANRRDTFAFLARELAASIKPAIEGYSTSDIIITNVPRRKASIRKDGYDHAEVIAKRIAKILEIKYDQFLVSRAKRSQKETHGVERRVNAVFEYKRKKSKTSLKHKLVIIVDDVVTTGSSMGSCAALLRGMGAKNIIGATLSIAFKEPSAKPL